MINIKKQDAVADAVKEILQQEALKGAQHKIDKNKNNRIDAHDFAILRGEKKPAKKEEKVEEGNNPFDYKNYTSQIPKKPGETAGFDSKKVSTGTVYTRKPSDEKEKEKPKGVKPKMEEVEVVDEGLGRLVSKIINKTTKPSKTPLPQKSDRREFETPGNGSNVKPPVKEEVEEINELKKATVKSYIKKKMNNLSGKNPKKDQESLMRAHHRVTGVKPTSEEVEQIDELISTFSGSKSSVKVKPGGSTQVANALNKSKMDSYFAQRRAENEKNKPTKNEEVEQIDEISLDKKIKVYAQRQKNAYELGKKGHDVEAERQDDRSNDIWNNIGKKHGQDALDRAHAAAHKLIKREEVEQVEEREMTSGETAERERIVKGMKKSLKGFRQRYGERAKSVMYATATKQAMKEDTIEEGKRPESDTVPFVTGANTSSSPLKRVKEVASAAMKKVSSDLKTK